MIIIADDDPVFARDLQQILRLERYSDMRVVGTGAELLSLVTPSGSPEVLMLDMMLPDNAEDIDGRGPPMSIEHLGGVRVLKELVRRKFDGSRVVVITAYCHPALNEELRKLGVLDDNIHIKPAATKAIIASVRSIYASK